MHHIMSLREDFGEEVNRLARLRFKDEPPPKRGRLGKRPWLRYLAKKLGVAHTTPARWVQGRNGKRVDPTGMKIRMLEKLSNELGVSVHYWFKKEKASPPPSNFSEKIRMKFGQIRPHELILISQLMEIMRHGDQEQRQGIGSHIKSMARNLPRASLLSSRDT